MALREDSYSLPGPARGADRHHPAVARALRAAVIPVLVGRGAQYLRLLGKDPAGAQLDLADTSRTLAHEEERRRFGAELHNYLIHTLDVFFGANLGDPGAAQQVRELFGLVRERLRNYMATGRFSEPVPFLDMLTRRHHGDPRRIGGDMTITSRPAVTQVLLCAPTLPPAAPGAATSGDAA